MLTLGVIPFTWLFMVTFCVAKMDMTFGVKLPNMVLRLAEGVKVSGIGKFSASKSPLSSNTAAAKVRHACEA